MNRNFYLPILLHQNRSAEGPDFAVSRLLIHVDRATISAIASVLIGNGESEGSFHSLGSERIDGMSEQGSGQTFSAIFGIDDETDRDGELLALRKRKEPFRQTRIMI